MYEVAVLATVILTAVSAADYIRRAWTRETNPALATWVLLQIMIGLTCWMYWQSPRRSWTANIGVNVGAASCLGILLAVLASNIRYGTLNVAFDAVQKWCLAGGALIVAFWSVTKQPLHSYVLVQCLALVAYAATMKRLWRAERSTEPLFFWVATLLANLCALYPAWARNDPFAWIYLARTVPSTTLVVYLIIRVKRKMRHQEQEQLRLVRSC